jgi:hypothetical protein
MWIETQTNTLVNLDALKSISARVSVNDVHIVGREGASDYVLIAIARSQEDAMKFLKKLMKESTAGKNFVSADAILISIENEKK